MQTLHTITVKQASILYSIPMGGLRKFLFERKTNGLSSNGAIIKVGRKLLIHQSLFEEWLLSHTENV